MHFSKTLAQLLVTLPPEFRNNALEYRKLKQLINQTARELDSLGLGPSVLRTLHELDDGHSGRSLALHSEDGSEEQDDSESDETLTADSESVSDAPRKHTIVYEIVLNSSIPQPRLRLSSGHPDDGAHHTTTPSTVRPIYHFDLLISEQLFGHITQELLHPSIKIKEEMRLLDNSMESDQLSDLIIPLPSDTAFLRLLTSTLSSLSSYLDTLQDNFNSTLASLAVSISSTARPASSSAPHSFHAYSLTADNSFSMRPKLGGKSDLYIWREIFRLYTETEVFEGIEESSRGERSIVDVEKRLELFQGRVQDKKASLALPGSKEAFDVFLNLNLLILNVKKFQVANSEATRKILKKHAKRTTLPIPSYLVNASPSETPSHQVSLITHPSKSLPRLLVQAIGEVLLPVVPHIDDYSCLICTSLAFKPIRLHCGHFFCVRCLVKMQRRGMANCPMCRAPTVLRANPSNVDYGLLNFMADWFPIESLEKLHANEEEVTREQLEAFGIADARVCRIM